MILKKDGVINEIIYNLTTYNENKNRHYPTIISLTYLIKQIIESNATTKYIRFNPFYRNYKKNCQIEFDEHMFYFECKEDFTEDDFNKHISACLGKSFDDLSEAEIRRAKILFPLCKFSDVDKYKEILLAYQSYLDELIPFLFNIAKTDMDLSEEDIAFGYFSFEVHSS